MSITHRRRTVAWPWVIVVGVVGLVIGGLIGLPFVVSANGRADLAESEVAALQDELTTAEDRLGDTRAAAREAQATANQQIAAAETQIASLQERLVAAQSRLGEVSAARAAQVAGLQERLIAAQHSLGNVRAAAGAATARQQAEAAAAQSQVAGLQERLLAAESRASDASAAAQQAQATAQQQAAAAQAAANARTVRLQQRAQNLGWWRVNYRAFPLGRYGWDPYWRNARLADGMWVWVYNPRTHRYVWRWVGR